MNREQSNKTKASYMLIQYHFTKSRYQLINNKAFVCLIYTQITYEERVVIADLWRKNKSYYFISKWLGRKYDTIKNEIERNGIYNEYGKIKYKWIN